jgi:hypothetical protein
MNKIIILDYTTGTTYIRTIPDHLQNLQGDELIEIYAEQLVFNSSEVEYMISEKEIDIA